jgi:hypothetical protein
VVVDVRLPAVLLVDVLVGDVDVLDGGVVVLMGVGGQEMDPVLAPMEVMGHVIVLVAMLQSVMLMMAPRSCHLAHLTPGRSVPGRPYTRPRDGAKRRSPAPWPLLSCRQT